jgi:excisionase family DNA binding protein
LLSIIVLALTKRGDMNPSIPFRERISCTIDEACAATGLGRSKLYEEIAAGHVAVHKIGKRTLVLVKSLERLIDPNARESAAA